MLVARKSPGLSVIEGSVACNWALLGCAFRSRLLARKREAAEAIRRKGLEELSGRNEIIQARTDADGSSPPLHSTTLNENPCGTVCATASTAAAAREVLPPSLALSTGLQGLSHQNGANWSHSLGCSHPVILPQGSDLVTYVQTENGERQEQHALYSRETGTFEQGKMNFRDMFGFIGWVHAEGGAPFPWESLNPAPEDTATEQPERRLQAETEDDIDDEFDPDAPSEKTVVSDIGFSRTGGFPWKESPGARNARDSRAASTKAGPAGKKGQSGWPVVDNSVAAEGPQEDPLWWNVQTDIFS